MDNPVVLSHNRTVSSLDPKASREPSGENGKHFIVSV